MEVDSITGESSGKMTVDYVNEALDDFGCSLAMGCEDELVHKLDHFSKLYNLSCDDLIDELAAFHKNENKECVSFNSLEAMESKVLSKRKKPASVHLPPPSSSNKRFVLAELSTRPELSVDVGDDDAFLCDGMSSEKKSERRFKSSPTGSPNGGANVKTSFSQKSFVAFTPKVPLVLPRLNILSDCMQESYTYGSDKTQQLVTELYDEESFANPPASETTGSCTTINGRLFPVDGEIVDGTNAMIVSPSLTVRLDLSKLEQCALYPGKPATVKGLHQGNQFVVEEFVEKPALATARIEGNNLQQLRIVIASGPYLSNADTQDNYLAKIIDEALKSNANALILVGPFMDKNQEKLTDVDMGVIMHEVSRRVQNSKLRVLVVPYAARDLAASPYFPTPPYYLGRRAYGIAENVKFLPDPAVFEVEGVRIAVNASEILVHLSRTERSWSPQSENEDRMTRLLSHVFRSGSLYPFYSLDSRNVPFNAHNSRKHLRLEKTPHLMIVPSFINPMIKVADNCVCVNPGRLVMGATAATFARVDIDVASAAAATASAGGPASIAPYSCVEIVGLNSPR
ncbi:DNA polymerase alpha subunit B family protein [Aphelenchoides avenae]|nr:DNA polymerase alpha subunit B family protein [Aphelenchus avenae]